MEGNWTHEPRVLHPSTDFHVDCFSFLFSFFKRLMSLLTHLLVAPFSATILFFFFFHVRMKSWVKGKVTTLP